MRLSERGHKPPDRPPRGRGFVGRSLAFRGEVWREKCSKVKDGQCVKRFKWKNQKEFK